MRIARRKPISRPQVAHAVSTYAGKGIECCGRAHGMVRPEKKPYRYTKETNEKTLIPSMEINAVQDAPTWI